MRGGPALVAGLALAACAPTRALAPLEPGHGAVTMSLGGPIVEAFGGPLPLPITSVGYVRGLDGRTILKSMFASADALADDGTGQDFPSGWFFEDPFDNVDAIGDLTSPVLLIHGVDDDYILVEYSDALFEAAPDPKQLWQPEGVGHSDIITVIPDEYAARVATFQDGWVEP